MSDHRVVSRSEWLEARLALLKKEKEFTKMRDQLSAERRALPWTKIDKKYAFATARGAESLADLFGKCSQLMVYHFMFGPDWEEGCPSCSFWADNYNGIDVHLAHRDITFLAISRAPLATLEAYKKRYGWSFDWVSSLGNDFNFDFNVSFSPDELERGEVYYNYHNTTFPSSEAPGLSVFYKNDRGEVFHTYSCYARGLDILNSAYHHMDMAPKGRDEDELPYAMAWVRRRNQYDGT